jgi:hypothetical protein
LDKRRKSFPTSRLIKTAAEQFSSVFSAISHLQIEFN